MKIRPIEIFLIQLVLYFVLWITYEYLALLLSVSIGGMAFILFLFSIVAEWIEKSKVPGWYFHLMIASFLAPLFSGGIFFLVSKLF